MSETKKRIRWTKEKVIEEIKALAASGESIHNRSVKRENNALLRAGIRYYDSWENAVTEAGFDYEEIKKQGRKEGSKRISDSAKKRYLSEEYITNQKESIIERLKALHQENPLITHGYLLKHGNGILTLINKYFGTIEEAMTAAGINYEEIKKTTSRRRWSDEHIVEQLEKIISNNESLNVAYIIENHRQLYRACVDYLGSWEAALALVGVNYSVVKKEHKEKVAKSSTLYSQEYVIGELQKMKENNEPLSRKWIKERSEALYDACYNRFGSIKNAVEAAGYDYEVEMEKAKEVWLQKQREIQVKWDKDTVVEEIKRLHAEGTLLSSTYVRNTNQSLYDGAVNRFGSWGEAIEKSGLSYDDIREDSRNASYCGRLFEELLDELFIEIGVEYEKYAHEKYRPDYVLKNNVWVDAKLSQWTVFASDTIVKYLDHCRFLTIVYMRGRRGEISDARLSPNVRIISVHKYIKQLPKHRQAYYLSEVEKIEAVLKTFEEWVN